MVKKAVPKKRKMGRPTKYSKAMGARICARLAMGESLRTVCKDPKLPSVQTVFNWFDRYPEFLDHYTRAKQESADAFADEILDIADDGTNDWMEMQDKQTGEITGYKVNGEALQRSRLRVDTRKWLASKMKPKKYGDRVDLGNADDKPLKLELVTEYLPAK